MGTRPRFTIATYNLLADSYIDPEDEHADIDPLLLDPRHRWPRLIERIRGMNADILCLQEAEPSFITVLERSLLSTGYIHRWHARAPRKPAGCSIFIKSSLVLEKTFSQPFESGRVLEGEATHIAQHGVIDCLEGHKLLVVNTHLPLDKPEKPVEKRFGIKQADELLTLLKERRMMFGCPAIICGDFNAAPDSETLKLFLDAGYHDPHDPQAPTYGRSRRGPRKVDHILFSEGQRVEALPTPVMNLEHVPPNEVEPSDHLPLIARFFFSP